MILSGIGPGRGTEALGPAGEALISVVPRSCGGTVCVLFECSPVGIFVPDITGGSALHSGSIKVRRGLLSCMRACVVPNQGAGDGLMGGPFLNSGSIWEGTYRFGSDPVPFCRPRFLDRGPVGNNFL